MSVTLRGIKETDLENIMRWRMDPDITRYMNTNPRLTLEGQRKWLDSIHGNPDVLYWLIQVDGQPAGVINLTGLEDPEGKLGWAYYVGEKKLRSMGTALSLEMSMYDHALDTLKKKAVYSDVFSLNKGVIQLHKICGCEIVEEKKKHICKEGVWYDVTYMRMTAERWMAVRGEKKYTKIEFPEVCAGGIQDFHSKKQHRNGRCTEAVTGPHFGTGNASREKCSGSGDAELNRKRSQYEQNDQNRRPCDQ